MTVPLWRWPELCAALGVAEVDGPDVSGISIDSRTVEPGDLFVALSGDPGPRFNPSQRSDRDGHDFIEQAFAAGAVGVLSHDSLGRSQPELKVADTLDGLWDLGRAARARLAGRVVAITGSSGKTTTKTLVSAALGAFATPGSLNNHLGVPLSLARTPREVDIAIFEIGTSHPGEIGPLSDLVRPDVAVLLNVHQAHAENFADKNALRNEKLSIINGLEGNSHFIVEDQVMLGELPGSIRVVRFGKSAAADIRLIQAVGETARYEIAGRTVDARLPGGGEHRALSLAAVLGVFTALDRDLAPALTLGDGLIPRGRGNRVDVHGITLIDDSYNANPVSMAAALRSLATVSGRKVALIGEMLELGEDSAAAHAGLTPLCQPLDRVICVGAGTRPLVDALDCDYFEVPAEALLELLRTELNSGDTLLVKGSNRVFWARDFFAQIESVFTS